MKIDSHLIGETIYCKKAYATSNVSEIPIGMSGIILETWRYNYCILFNNKFNEYVHFDQFDKYFCEIKEYRKLKLEKLNK